jgi:hypothetical protein
MRGARMQCIHGVTAHARCDDADVIVVPLHPNHHASGITVLLEAVMAGKAVVATGNTSC